LRVRVNSRLSLKIHDILIQHPPQYFSIRTLIRVLPRIKKRGDKNS
jgi:hypothetical protein